MPSTERLDLKIKRLTAIEAAYRAEIKRAHAGEKDDRERKLRYERTIAKYERKMEKLLPKIRRLREIRTAMRDR